MPGVPAAGHITARGGYWHPGRAEGCAKCPPDGYITGDGVRHTSRAAAFAHADKVARETGRIIAIEEDR